MRDSKEGPSSTIYQHGQAIDLKSHVKALHGLGSQELAKLLNDSENLTFTRNMEDGSILQIDMEKLARLLPLHLIAVTMSSQRDEALLRYLLCGLRFLHSLCETASRFPRLEQILLDDVKVSEQLLDLVFYSLIVFSGHRKEHHVAGAVSLLHSTVIACSLYLLRGCISTHWHELAYVLVTHPKVDIFTDASFRAVFRNINFLRISLSATQNDLSMDSSIVAKQTVNHLCQQCEASLQFLQSLSQHKTFRECLLRNKELCGKGGILQLAKTTLQVNIPASLSENPAIVAAVSRLKSRILSILLQLCETESVSFLDEVAAVQASLESAKSVALEILTLAGKCPRQHRSPSGKTYPTGLLQLNALRLVDIFSDDSNFRSFITLHFTEVLAKILSLPNQEFLSSWCSSDLPEREEDATLDYDPYGSAERIIHSSSLKDFVNIENSESTLLPTNVPQASYAHQRTSFLVKVIANLHCFVPKICEEQERNFFLHKFLDSLQLGLPTCTGFSAAVDPRKTATVSKNLRLLLGHAESLIPTFLNDEDVQLFRVFFTQLQTMINPNDSEEDRDAKGCSSLLVGNTNLDPIGTNGNLKEGFSENSAFQEVDLSYVQDDPVDEADITATHCHRKTARKHTRGLSRGTSSEFYEKDVQQVESSGSDSNSARGKDSSHRVYAAENSREFELSGKSICKDVEEHEKIENFKNEENQQPRKRKRTIMNDKQVAIIESALLVEPDMQKNAASLQAWAERLRSHGSDISSSQLKNWLNNRKAKLARLAKDKDSRPLPEADSCTPDKQDGLVVVRPCPDSPENPSDNVVNLSSNKIETCQSKDNLGESFEAAAQSELPADRANTQVECSTSNYARLQPCQHVLLIDDHGTQIAHARVHQVRDKWGGINLEETKTCVVDIIEYSSERYLGPHHPLLSQGGGVSSLEDGDVKVGKTRVLWDSSKILLPQQR